MSGGVHGPVLFYDGLCALCNRAVRLVLRHDRRGRIRFAPLQGEAGRELRERHPGLEDVDSLVWVEDLGDEERERPVVRSEAVLRAAEHMDGGWRALTLLRLVPRRIRDWTYDVCARHRHRLFGRYDECPVPDAEVRSRFLP